MGTPRSTTIRGWNPTLKGQHLKWRDIIPAFNYSGSPGGHFEGLNLVDGAAILANRWETTPPPVQEFGSLTVVKAVNGVVSAAAAVQVCPSFTG
jgi:hypothetical protein